jgi:DNA mismatch repair ATPase MutS
MCGVPYHSAESISPGWWKGYKIVSANNEDPDLSKCIVKRVRSGHTPGTVVEPHVGRAQNI